MHITYELYKQNTSPETIAQIRGLSLITIESHLCYFIGIGELEVDEFVSKPVQQQVQKAVEAHGAASLKLLKENLPDEITYGNIRMVLASAGKL